MSIEYTTRLSCDAPGCLAFEMFESVGDQHSHDAAARGWRWSHTGRALCETHARREMPGSFAGKHFSEPEPTDEDLLS